MKFHTPKIAKASQRYGKGKSKSESRSGTANWIANKQDIAEQALCAALINNPRIQRMTDDSWCELVKAWLRGEGVACKMGVV